VVQIAAAIASRLTTGVLLTTMIRKYKPGDEKYLARIYHDAIYQLAANDYTHEQLDAWANPPLDIEDPKHKQRCEAKQPVVNERDGRVVGFMELDPDGHIDCVYVDPAHAGTGVMSEIMEEIKKEARRKDIPKLFAEVSKTARPFFEHHGFVWVRDITVNIRGVSLENYIMEYLTKAEQGAASHAASQRP
jgi:putative acetyltransferase